MGHIIGFNGWKNGTNGLLPSNYESTFDEKTIFNGSNLFFTGASAVAVYGGNIPLTYNNYGHLGNNSPRPGSNLVPDLMNGVVYNRGSRYNISSLDLAILSDIGLPINNPKPTLTITASDAAAAETNTGQTANPGRFIFTRTGSTAAALTVNYTVAGTATRGTDYSNITNSITIPVGQTSVTIPINPINDSLYEGNETAIVALAASTAYNVGTANSATVTIADNEATPPDNAGNTTAAARNLGALTGSLSVSDFISTTVDPNDYYRFNLSIPGSISLLLNGLSSDADLHLLNSSGTVIARSENFGTTQEAIALKNITAGTYYVRVFPYSSSSTNYNLTLRRV